MAYGILLLRLAAGITLSAHGAQKLFGWFGGHGPRGTAGFFASLGFRPAYPMALLAGLSEAAGLLFAFGFVTPLASLAIASVMVVAVGSVHLRNGFFATAGGYEYNLVLAAVALAVAATGPGRFSVDNALGWADNLSGVWWGVGVLLAALLGGLAVLALRETPHDAEATDEPMAREAEAERVEVSSS